MLSNGPTNAVTARRPIVQEIFREHYIRTVNSGREQLGQRGREHDDAHVAVLVDLAERRSELEPEPEVLYIRGAACAACKSLRTRGETR